MAALDLISDPRELQPQTDWRATKWAWTPEESLVSHEATPRFCAAALLPFKDGKPDWGGFIRSLRWILDAGKAFGVETVVVLNADTGYIFDLGDDLYAEVLRRFREEFPHEKFIAGVTARAIEEDSGFCANRYRPLLDLAQAHENCEVMIMTSRHLNALGTERRRDAYFEIAESITRPALVHALEPAFVPWATPFEPWLLWQLAQHPKFCGGKISTLDAPHFLYWAAMCRDLNLPFVPHSGDDFGIGTAIRLGLPLLVGAGASAAPLICAAIDAWRFDSVQGKRRIAGSGNRRERRFDTRVYKLLEAIQAFEDFVFRLDARGSAAAYKHSTAHALKLLGLLESAEVHPQCRDKRDSDEPALMRAAMRRAERVAALLDIPGFRVDAGGG